MFFELRLGLNFNGKLLTRHICYSNSRYHKRCLISSVANNLVYRRDEESEKKYHYTTYHSAFLFTSVIAATVYSFYSDVFKSKASCNEKSTSLPTSTYTREEVSKKTSKETGIWVIYNNKVFDITAFVENHPGGSSKIMLAAGKNLEPFWDIYAIHKKDEIFEMLNEFYIGDLEKNDWIDQKSSGPFANDPPRHPGLLVCSKEPFNAETPSILLNENLLTPNELFFIRNHLPVPDLSNNAEIVIEGDCLKEPIILSVEDIKAKFEKFKLIAAIQCAGNRRNEMNAIKSVKGLTWNHSAISNAEWGGVLLYDILISAGVDPNNSNIKHIHFEGCDLDPSGAPYGASIPADRVFKKQLPIIIAYEMNGKPLSRDHGFPLRVIAPGIVGARNVKWLKRIILSDKEYNGHWQQNDYKPFSPNIDWHNVDFKKAMAIQELPVTSAICLPLNDSTVHENEKEVTIKGYAYSGGGCGIIRVDVSVDSGKTWVTADLVQADQNITDMYSWTLWECSVPIPIDHHGKMEIICKAQDSSCNTQPETVGPVWNLRGVLNNAWHRVQVNVETD
ncbi:sulfite oxidase [Hydra vulgaris]|uniref:sulfite oxidase n=1 Tax=Hydra vulgaris TaxID=6087 RepID=UPI001F5E9E16|nr:sulfite oxidase [Hydra vulgaris]